MAKAADFVGFAPALPSTNPLRTPKKGTFSASAGEGPTAAAVITAGNAGAYDVSSNKVLNVYFSTDGGTKYRSVSFSNIGSGAASAAAATAAEIAAVLNANTTFAAFLLASNNSGSLRITSLNLGTKAKIYVTGSANTPLGFTQVATGSAGAGTGTVATLTLTAKNARGEVIPGAKGTLTLYAASSGSTQDSTAKLQNASKGSFITGNRTSQATFVTNEDGQITFDVSDTATGATDAYAEVAFDDCDNVDNATRTTVTTGAS